MDIMTDQELYRWRHKDDMHSGRRLFDCDWCGEWILKGESYYTAPNGAAVCDGCLSDMIKSAKSAER